ncbi:MAG: hypothetical protein HZC48_12105 [Nitrospirae bacterium]|nr:hypothetical protein [Nitrospirota bacterium]
MAFIKCSFCSKQFSDKLTICPFCRKHIEEWKPKRLQETKEKLPAEPQELPPKKQSSDRVNAEKFIIPAAKSKSYIIRIGWIGIFLGVSLFLLGISIFVMALLARVECDAKCIFGGLFLMVTGLIMAVVFYVVARE